MTSPFHLLPLVAALVATSALAAPEPAAAPAPDAQVHRIVIDADAMAQAMASDATAQAFDELRQERIVQGAPYCADAVHESIQPLADGNRIVHSRTTRTCRDGEGRTRQEIDRDGHPLVYLRDPVAKEGWLLDPEKKTARKLGVIVDTAAWREYGQRMHDWAEHFSQEMRSRIARGDEPETAAADARRAVPPTPPAPPVPPTPPAAPLILDDAVAPAPVLVSADDGVLGKDGQRRDVRVHVLRVDGAPGLPPLPALSAPPAVLARSMLLAPRGPGSTSPLGSKELDGVKADGERTSWTIAAGKIGNEKPIVITREVWTSPDLMLTLSSRDFDPRSGEIVYRLQNLKRGEPAAEQMRVPADYRRVEGAPRPPRAASTPRG